MRITIPPAVLSQRLSDEMVLLHLDSSTYFGLNPLGARIWRLLQSSPGSSLEQLRATLSAEYAVDDAELTRDLLQFVRVLNDHRLITMRET